MENNVNSGEAIYIVTVSQNISFITLEGGYEMKKINFTEQQLELFEKLVDEHRSRYYISKQLNCTDDAIRTLARYKGIKYLQEHYDFTEDIIRKIKTLYETTNLSVNQIEKRLHKRDVMGYIIDNYSKDYRDSRHKRLLSEQKIGDGNPMYRKFGETHPNYKELVSDGKGYIMILKPDWYTGRPGCKHIYYHHYVMCMYLGISEIPSGMVVHHIDFDKTNNDIKNLALMTNEGHMKLHRMLTKSV